MSFDKIFDLTAGVYFNFYNIYSMYFYSHNIYAPLIDAKQQRCSVERSGSTSLIAGRFPSTDRLLAESPTTRAVPWQIFTTTN